MLENVHLEDQEENKMDLRERQVVRKGCGWKYTRITLCDGLTY
jgi:hypothetical protein